MKYEAIDCLEPSNPECLCSECVNFFENGLKRFSQSECGRNVIYVGQKGFIFRQNNDSDLREVIYG